jgi:hypothetical protein
LRWINYASGGMIASFGIITITKSMLEFFWKGVGHSELCQALQVLLCPVFGK